jgi:predicted phage-related endonuclease
MSTIELSGKIKELRELRRMAEELEEEITGLEDTIKARMTAEDTDTLTGTDYKVTWKTVRSTRFDSAAFKSTHAELYQQYSKQTENRRFVVA